MMTVLDFPRGANYDPLIDRIELMESLVEQLGPKHCADYCGTKDGWHTTLCKEVAMACGRCPGCRSLVSTCRDQDPATALPCCRDCECLEDS